MCRSAFVLVLYVSGSLCTHVKIAGKGKRKCFRGKWINGRIQQGHPEPPGHMPDWAHSTHTCVCVCVCVREREREKQMSESKEKQDSVG